MSGLVGRTNVAPPQGDAYALGRAGDAQPFRRIWSFPTESGGFPGTWRGSEASSSPASPSLVIAAQAGIATAPAPPWSARPAATPTASPAAYLTVIIGRSMFSKASSCTSPATPPGMLTLDQVVPQLAQLGVNVTAAVIPDRILPTKTNCVNGTLYPSWADLTSLAATYGLNAVSASEDYEYMTTLTQTQQFQQSCGSLATLISHGFHRAWGLFAYPDNYYSTSVQSAVVEQLLRLRKNVYPPAPGVGCPGDQQRGDDGCAVVAEDQRRRRGPLQSRRNQPCDSEGSRSLGKYLDPNAIQALTRVSRGRGLQFRPTRSPPGRARPGPSSGTAQNRKQTGRRTGPRSSRRTAGTTSSMRSPVSHRQ